jgi:hypothetical protein
MGARKGGKKYTIKAINKNEIGGLGYKANRVCK